MAEISAGLVRDLRAKTGAGMMDCKKALAESAGDLEAAVDWLRTKGLASAAKKAGRVATEGLVGVSVKGTKGSIVEINSETDFVARNGQFQDMVRKVAEIALGSNGDTAAIAAMPYPGSGRTVQEEITNAIATIGENLTFRRASVVEVPQGVVTAYVHNAAGSGVGKIGVLVALKSAGKTAALEAFGKQVAMHIAAANPQSVGVKDLDPAAVERERGVLSEQAKDSGKPAEIVAKMVEGRLRKFYQDVVLLEQTFVIDGETRVAKAVEAAAKEAGAAIEVAGFRRFSLGEGIEKPAEDFAAEVAKIAR
ncbi:MAG TPA: translation elongation factor Ts [Candidatus Cybelea sp.]|nr:translation elongation factor Ts [Candidatus Cybelea sp.]